MPPRKKDADEACRRVAEEQHNVIGRADAYRCGHDKKSLQRRVRAGEWHELRPSAYSLGPPSRSWEQNLVALCVSVDGVAFRRSAAALHRFPGFGRREIEVVTTRLRVPTGRGIHRTRYLPDEHCTIVDGICCTTPARTAFDLCSIYDARRMRGLLLHLMSKGDVTPTDAYECLDCTARCGRPGSSVYRRALAGTEIDAPPPASLLEDRAFEIITRAGHPVPKRQHALFIEGVLLGYLDLAFPKWRVGVEADGWDSHRSKARFLDDRSRQNGLVSHGWIILRFTERDAQRPRRFLTDLERALRLGRRLAASGIVLPG